MKQLTINGDIIKIPSWNEFTKAQLIKLAACSIEKPTITDFCLQALFIITGLKINKKKHVVIDNEECFYISHGRKKTYLVGESDLAAITLSLREHFFYETQNNGQTVFVPEVDLYNPTINWFRVGNLALWAPAKALANLIFEEYIYTETYYTRYVDKKNEVFMDNLISVLYRPKQNIYNRIINKNYGDKREEFNIYKCKQRAKTITKLDKATRQVILWYYSGCRNYLKQKFPFVFSGTGSASGKDTFEVMLELTTSISGSSINNEKTRKTMLYDILSELNTKADPQNKPKSPRK